MSKIRRKRASPTDLYKACIAGADCIPDVQNKIEGKTWADTLLKIFGSLVYFGNLGIGTGRGTGGTGGYRPLGAQTPARTPSLAPPRPSIPNVEVIGPAEILPISPEAPAIVPLQEGVPDIGLIDTPGAGPGLDVDPIEVTTAIDPVSEVVGVGEHPNVISNTNEVAQIDVQLAPPPPKRIALDPSFTDNTSIVYTRESHVDPNVNVFVNPLFDAVNIGQPEYIELQEINLREEFEISEGPIESTPLSTRAINRARDLYSRFVQQVPTRQADILGLSSRPSTVEFENPAFETDVSDVFHQDVLEVSQQVQNTQLKFVSEPRLSQTPGRTVRLSRLAQKPGMTTRSGLEIGQRVHLYYDISTVQPESIELQPLGEYSHESTWVDELASTTFINPFENAINGFSDDVLLDPLDENFSNSHLLLTATDTAEDNIEIPSLPPGIGLNIELTNLGKDIFVYNEGFDLSDVNVPFSPLIPINPSLGASVIFDTYDLHPSLLKRKRKRPFS